MILKKIKENLLLKIQVVIMLICAGLKEDIFCKIKGHVGYYCGGMNQNAKITVEGNAGTGLGENMMSGLNTCKRKCFTNQLEQQLMVVQ